LEFSDYKFSNLKFNLFVNVYHNTILTQITRAKKVLIFWGIKMANIFCQQVLKPLGSYTRVFTVLGISESLIHVAISLDLNIYVFSGKRNVFIRLYRSYIRRGGIKLVKEMK